LDLPCSKEYIYSIEWGLWMVKQKGPAAGC